MNLAEQLLRDEGLVLHEYKDSLGYSTIGVGRLIDARRGGGISRDEALALLANDIVQTTCELHVALPWTKNLDDARKGVLLNMAFNLGVPALEKFKDTLACVQRGDYVKAAVAMLDSAWAKQVGDRATRLSKQMETGVWQ